MEDLLNSTVKKSPLPAILIVAVLLGAVAGVYILSSGAEEPSDTDGGDDVEQNNGEDIVTDGTQGNETVDTGNATTSDGNQTTDTGNSTIDDGNQTTDGTDPGGDSGDNHTDDDHDHGTGETPTPPPAEPEDPVVIPDVAPSLNFSASGTLQIEPFTLLPTNTSIDIDLQTGGSEITTSPALPTGLSIDSEGHLVGTLTTPFRNQRVNLTHNGSTFEVAFTAYDLSTDYTTLTSITDVPSQSTGEGAVVIPITEPGLAFALDKESAPQIAATYAYGSKIVAAGGTSIFSAEYRRPIFDSSINWACGSSGSVYLILDPENQLNQTQYENSLTELGYTISQDFDQSECMVAIGGGAITHPDNLSNWLTHQRGAVVLGTNSFIQSVNHGELFVAAGTTIFSLSLDEETYSPLRNGHTALNEIFSNYQNVSTDSPAVGTVKGIFQVDRERGYMYDGSGYGENFMEMLGELVMAH